jgi:hypothetical protein
MSRSRVHRPSAARRSRIAFIALAWTLALVQWLGVVHGVAHAPAAKAGAAATVADASTPGASWSLFGGHDGDSPACHLYDQLSHGDALWHGEGPPAGIAPAHFIGAVFETVPRAATTAHFLARAPPIRS